MFWFDQEIQCRPCPFPIVAKTRYRPILNNNNLIFLSVELVNFPRIESIILGVMSADEDTELRDLVAQTLENTGVLGKIRVCFKSLILIIIGDLTKKRHNEVQNSAV